MSAGNNLLDFFRRHAPDAPIGTCLKFRDTLESLDKSEYHLKCVLAALSYYLCYDNGKIRDSVDLTNGELALEKAMQIVQNMHAWVVCGPGPGMKEFLDEFTKEHTDG